MATIRPFVKTKGGQFILLKSGKLTVFQKYTHDSEHLLITTDVRITPDQWNYVNNQIYPIKGVGQKEKNLKIQQTHQKLMKIVLNLQAADIDPSVEEVKKALIYRKQEKNKIKGLSELLDEYVSYSYSFKAEKSGKLAERVKIDFTEFCQYLVKKRKLSSRDPWPKLYEINQNYYDGYVKYLSENRDMAKNSVGKCIKNFKAFLNYNKKRGYKIHPDVKGFIVFNEDTPIIYLTQDELQTLFQYDFLNERMNKVRDVFCIQSFTGLRWSDLSRLGKHHIQNGVIRMSSYKTKKEIIIPIVPRAAKLLEKYDYQIPRVTGQEINRIIKQACKKAGINREIEIQRYKGGKKEFLKVPVWSKVSTHTAVKTFITHCAERGISPKVVATITGKTVAVILKHYYGTNEDQIIREMNKAFN
ncbi:MAG: tyrosine-type recombinase/integrase [Cyclobacteriaceae bacterium]